MLSLIDTFSAMLAADVYGERVENTESAMTEGARDIVGAHGFKTDAKTIKCIVEGAQKYLNR